PFQRSATTALARRCSCSSLNSSSWGASVAIIRASASTFSLPSGVTFSSSSDIGYLVLVIILYCDRKSRRFRGTPGVYTWPHQSAPAAARPPLAFVHGVVKSHIRPALCYIRRVSGTPCWAAPRSMITQHHYLI